MTGVIWYIDEATKERANVLLDRIKFDYHDDDARERRTSFGVTRQVNFSNGDTWSMIRVIENQYRGRKCNVSYLPKEIDCESDGFWYITRMCTCYPYAGFNCY